MKNLFSHKFFFFFILSLALALGSGQIYAQAPQIIYIYDDLGRLIRVVDQNNECATYEYDAVGNLLRITRGTNCLQPPTIDSLSQDRARANETTCITITGSNFLGATVTTDKPGVQISRVRVTETGIEVCLIISPFASLGTSNIVVTTAGGTVTRPFTIDPRTVLITQNTTIAPADQTLDNTALTIEGPITVTIDGTHRFGSVTLRGGAVLTHSGATGSSTSKLDLAVDTTVTIDSTSRIDVTGKGFLGGAQPGNPLINFGMTVGFQRGSGIRAGGSYGGFGGGTAAGNPGPVYGDFRNPNEPGSGGGESSGAGGNGGGLIRIVAQTIQLDGSILATGGSGLNSEAGGGSGGGIRIDVGTLSGAGNIAVNGGRGGSGFAGGSGGGGGRVAIYYQNIAGFDLTKVTASGSSGVGTGSNGGAGTVYLQGPGRETGEIVVDNDNLFARLTPVASPPSNVVAPPSLRVRRTGVVVDESNDFTNLMLESAGLMTHNPATENKVGRLDLKISGTLTIDSTSRLDANARGFLGGAQPGNPYTNVGMTVGFGQGSGIRAGGSYGGLGGAAHPGTPNPVYGDVTNPIDPGSGGGESSGPGGNGGGLIRVVAQTMHLDGSILANGGSGLNSEAGGGSGGGIRIDVGTLQGNGRISANGGNGGTGFGGGAGGGGGRVAIYYQNLNGFNLSRVTALGGAGGGSAPGGQNGTLHLEPGLNNPVP